jgi:hypothetical protein
LSTIMPCQTRLKKLVLADHRTRRLNQRRQCVEGVAAEPYLAGWPAGQDPERQNSTIAGGVEEANYGR